MQAGEASRNGGFGSELRGKQAADITENFQTERWIQVTIFPLAGPVEIEV
jgi:hypothetical protein